MSKGGLLAANGDDLALEAQMAIAEAGGVRKLVARLLEGLDAETSVRVPDEANPGKYKYQVERDWQAVIGSGALLAKIARMMPETSAGAKVNVNVGQGAVELSRDQIMAEALSVGIDEEAVLLRIEADVAEVRAARAKGGQGQGVAPA